MMGRKPTLQRLPGARLPGENRAAHRATTPSKWIPASARASREQEQSQLRDGIARMRQLLSGLGFIAVVLTGRAFWVMNLPHEAIETRAAGQGARATEKHGERGDLLDRTGRVLATTVHLPALYANPRQMPRDEMERWLPDVVRLTGRDEAWVRARMMPADGRRPAEIRLAAGVDPEAANEFLGRYNAHIEALKNAKTPPKQQWLWIHQEPTRVYPGRELGAPLIGFVDALENGGAGLEKVLDRELRGESYRVLVEQDRKGYSVGAGADESRLARDGHTVRLTIDASLQDTVEDALMRAVEASRPETAFAVVMDVRTGGILAMANWPSGNPNDFVQRGKAELFKNHAVMDQIEPGSVMKPFVVAAAMEEGLVTPERLIDCKNGHWAIGGKVINDDHPKGVISVTEVIKYSSNIGTAQIGLEVGGARLFKYLKQFGFGRRTGLGFPGETAGTLRNGETATPLDVANTSFGQGMTATPVQLAAATAALANDGMRMQPYLVDATVESGVVTRHEPREDRQVVSPEVARTVLAMMQTVTEEGGTGTKARVPGYKVAGKTGTAQKADKTGYSATKRIGSFVGVLPADRPEIVIAVSVDTPTVGSKYGGIVAGPAFAEIGTFAMRYLGVPPDPEPVELPATLTPADANGDVSAPAAAPAKPTKPAAAPLPSGPVKLEREGANLLMPDLKGRAMRDVIAGLGAAGLRVDVQGSGKLIEQTPAAGSILAPGSTVTVRFQ